AGQWPITAPCTRPRSLREKTSAASGVANSSIPMTGARENDCRERNDGGLRKALYRLRHPTNGMLENIFDGGRNLSTSENPASLFDEAQIRRQVLASCSASPR